MDPYLLGVYLGDGHRRDGTITSADPETSIRMQAYIDDVLNPIRPGHFLQSIVQCRAGDTFEIAGRQGTCKVTTYRLRITHPQWGMNLWRSALAELRCLETKAAGVPLPYLQGSEEEKAGVLAGLMDSDGSLTPGYRYRFTQSTEEHRLLVYHTRDLAESIGIHCNEVVQYKDNYYGSPKWEVCMRRGSEHPTFQRQLLPRKRLPPGIAHRELSLKKIRTVELLPEKGKLTWLTVSGGSFQLGNGIMVGSGSPPEFGNRT